MRRRLNLNRWFCPLHEGSEFPEAFWANHDDVTLFFDPAGAWTIATSEALSLTSDGHTAQTIKDECCEEEIHWK